MFRGTVLLVASLALVGCGGSPDGRLQVTGEVSLDGQPLSEGYLTLEPLGEGPSAGAKIENGQFTVYGQKGPKPGKYLIRIEARRETGNMISTDPDFPEEQTHETEQYLPARYNEQSELTEEITPENTHFVWDLVSG